MEFNVLRIACNVNNVGLICPLRFSIPRFHLAAPAAQGTVRPNADTDTTHDQLYGLRSQA